MNIQIYGTRKCFDTQKAERYFKERKIKYQYIDLAKYGLSKRELESVQKAVGLNNLINMDAPLYKQLNLHMIGTPSMGAEILLNHPRLYKSPVVRNGQLATVEFQPEQWQQWV